MWWFYDKDILFKSETDKKSARMNEQEVLIHGGTSIYRKFINWKLHNFAELFVYREKIKQQKMEFDLIDSQGVKSKWRTWLDFCPREVENAQVNPVIRNEDSRHYLTLFICLVSKTGGGTPYVDAQIVPVVEGNGTQIFVGAAGEDAKYEPGLHWHWTIEELEMNSAISRHLPTQGDSLDITLEIAILEEGSFESASKRGDLEAKMVADRKEGIFRAVSQFANDEKNSDVKIISKDGQQFFAYSWMLALASDVFEAMFRVDMIEKDTGAVNFKDLSGKTVKILLHFVYTGEICPEWKNAGTVEEIIYAADKYQIMKLRDFLNAELGNVCTVENTGSLLRWTNQTGLQKAEADILEFVKKNMTDSKRYFEFVHNSANELIIEPSVQVAIIKETSNECPNCGESPKTENNEEQNAPDEGNFDHKKVAMEVMEEDVKIINGNDAVGEDRPGTSRPTAGLNSLAERSSKRRRRTRSSSEFAGNQNDANVGGYWLRQGHQLQPSQPPPPAHSRTETATLSHQRRPLGFGFRSPPSPNSHQQSLNNGNQSGQPYPRLGGNAHTQPRQNQNLENSNSVSVDDHHHGHADGQRQSPASPLDLAGRGDSK